MTRHVAVWLDHTVAHLYEIAPDSFQRSTIKAHGDARQHHKAGSIGDGRHASNEAFYHAVAAGLAGAREIYLCGPGMAKTEFQKHAERHDHGVAGRIVRVESCDHPSDNQIAASARRFFKAFERSTPLDQA